MKDKDRGIRIVVSDNTPENKSLITNCSTEPRPASVSFHASQYMRFMEDIMSKFKFRYGAFKWELEQGEIVEPDGITLFVNLWVEGKPLMPMMAKYIGIRDNATALQKIWQEHFRKFVNMINDRDIGAIKKIDMCLELIRVEKYQLEQEKKKLKE